MKNIQHGNEENNIEDQYRFITDAQVFRNKQTLINNQIIRSYRGYV